MKPLAEKPTGAAFSLPPPPGTPTTMSRWNPGTTPVWSPCGSGKLLRLSHLRGNSCTLHFCCCILCVRLVNRILLTSERSRLAQPWTALPFRPRGNAGISLRIRKQGAIMTRGGAEPGTVLQLGRCARILGSDPAAPALLVAPQQVEHPVAAPATPDRRVKTSS